MKNKKRKIVLITGASKGIGKSVCLDFAKQGMQIIGCSRGKKDLNLLKRELKKINSNQHHLLDIDLIKKNSVDVLFNYIKKNKIYPDIIVNNVGGNLNYTNPLGLISEWQQVMRLNVEVAIEINRLCIPHMRKKKWGRICHVSSISALENQGPPAYCASKAALNAYVRSVGRFVSKDNIIMTSIMPGPVFTDDNYWGLAKRQRPNHVKKFLKDRVAINRFAKVREISNVISFLCSESSSYCVGTCVLVDGGQGRTFYPDQF